MAFLGHSSRVIISSAQPENSVVSWMAVGFDLQTESGGHSRLTDGQILLTIVPEHFHSPALAYFHHDVQKLHARCVERGIQPHNVERNEDGGEIGLSLQLNADLEIFIRERKSDPSENATREQSRIMGYFDSFVIGVADAHAAKHFAEALGFFVLEETRVGFTRIDMTDGLSVVSFRESQRGRFLSYTADVDEALHKEFLDVSVKGKFKYNRISDSLIKLIMPDGTLIMISDDAIEGT